MGKLKETVEEKGLTKAPQRTIADVMKSQWGKIEAVMPKHMSSERLFQMAVSTINHDTKLAQCDITTILSCLMRCSALGMEPSSVDGLGRAYILPFRNKGKMEATFILGYKGMIDIARRSGEIRDISARTVHEGDTFEFAYGLDEQLYHVPGDGERTQETMTHAYMVCHFKDGGHYIDVMTKAEVDAIRARSKSPNEGPWKTDYLAMARKTVIRRAFPYLPVSVEAQKAAANDETSGGYTQDLAVLDLSELPATPESAEDAPEEPIDAKSEEAPTEPESALQTPPEAPRRAVCRKCGYVTDEVTPDATLEDLQAAATCCDAPKYGWAE